MISTNSKYLALLLLLCVCSSCKTFSRLTNKGGIDYTVEIQTEEPNQEEIVGRTVKVLQNKLNAVGLDGEVSRAADKPNQISVKLYGTNDAERIKKFLFTTYRLELKKAITLTSFPQQYPTKEAAEKAATKEQEVLPYSEIDESRPPQYVIVEKKAVIDGEDIRDASAYQGKGSTGDYQILFSLKPESAAKFGDWTGKNIGQYLAIVLDKKVLSIPYIRGQIFDQGTIEGRFTKESAEDIALSLRSGYLPATMKILEEKPFN
jgi:preprotein translocase subunit SecD